MLRLRNMHD